MNVCSQKIFKEIYVQWNEPIQRFLQSRGLDLNKAADLSQDVFEKMWKNCKTITPEKAKSFLFTAASNLFIDDYRRHKTALKYRSEFITGIEHKDGQYLLEMNEFKDRLESVIHSMTNASKEVFVMSRFNRMTYKEISEALGISVKAVEKRMSKALLHLVTNKIKIKN